MEMIGSALDIDAVRAFVCVVDLGGFTRAADALGTRQAAISLRVLKLEERLGRRLLERSSRSVRLSADGKDFIEEARGLLNAHDRALQAMAGGPRPRLAIGFSEHVIGASAAELLRPVAASDPRLALEAHIGPSRRMLEMFDSRLLDVAIVRAMDDPAGERLFSDEDGWFAAADFVLAPDQPVPLIVLAEPCAMREIAAAALDGAGRAWRESFVGGGFAAVCAAVVAGLGVAPLARRLAPAGAVEVEGLPRLATVDVVARTRIADPAGRATFQMLRSTLMAQRGNRR